MSKSNLDLLKESANIEDVVIENKDISHLIINKNKVLSQNSVKGLNIVTEEIKDGLKVYITLEGGMKIKYPVHLCFGMIPKNGIQNIQMKVTLKKDSSMSVLSHCAFPNAVDLTHIMDADIHLEENSFYKYMESHTHSESKGITVIPKTIIRLDKKAKFSTIFELIKGRVGSLDIDYEAYCGEGAQVDMLSKISGRGDDEIKIKEIAYLEGDHSTGVLNSRIAVRNEARAEIYNKIVALGDYSRGHVDCKEIIQDNGTAHAIPIIEVKSSKAHVTHEAAIGSVDSKELQTLMSRGMEEEAAVDLIVQSLLS